MLPDRAGRTVDAMTQYMVEGYVPGATEASLEDGRRRIEAAAEQIAADGTSIRYLGSTFVPEEESCFCWFESASVADVSRACELAGITFARIVEAHGLMPAESAG